MKEPNDRGYFHRRNDGRGLNQAAQSVAAEKQGCFLRSSYAVSVFVIWSQWEINRLFPFPQQEGESAVVAFVE